MCDPDPDWQIEGEVTEDHRRVKLSRLHPGEQFAYVFDLGDDWAHLCTVGARRIDPVEVLGILPDTPLPSWGWGDIPDQYRRSWDDDDDDGESPPPRNPGLADLPPLRPHWGPGSRRPKRRFTALQPGTCRPGNHPPGLPRARPKLPRAPAQNTQIRTILRRFRQIQTDAHNGYARGRHRLVDHALRSVSDTYVQARRHRESPRPRAWR
ncbi:MAG: hypothetical protein ACM3ML_05810 [Micromonosporaceae bacterium]